MKPPLEGLNLNISIVPPSAATVGENDENRERGNWSSKLEFILSILSYAVGLGNIWRFPYLVYSNGGGAFLIPYFIMLFTAGLPLFFLELAFGQFASEGPITIWKISPLFQGLGYGMFIVSALVGIYYNMIIAWTFIYLVSSFTSDLPWNSCSNSWNSPACRRYDVKNCTSISGFMSLNGTCVFQNGLTNEEWSDWKKSEKPTTPSEEYFHNYMLNISDGMHHMGAIRWQLALSLFFSWGVCYFALLKGVKSFGKVSYFTAFFPYLVLVILLIRAATLPGYMDGILFYVTPKWETLLTAKIWGDAAVQIFFSLAPCWGGVITLASYNNFNNNCFRDAVFVGIVNPLTSVFAGFVIFGIVGYMSYELGVSVDEVVGQGAGLAFVAYPEAITRLPLSPLWAILFFVMLLTLGLGTQFTILETVVTTLVDGWSGRLRKYHTWVLLAICSAMFMMGLILCTEGGMYMLQLMDAFCASYSTLFIGVLEVFVVAWLYGVDRFMNDIKLMLGDYPSCRLYWEWCWKYITPGILMFILLFNFAHFTPPKYNTYEYPTWSLVLGWSFTAVSIAVIPAVAFYKISKEKGSFHDRIRKLAQPSESWGPKLAAHRALANLPPKHVDSRIPLAGWPESEQADEEAEAHDVMIEGEKGDGHRDDPNSRV